MTTTLRRQSASIALALGFVTLVYGCAKPPPPPPPPPTIIKGAIEATSAVNPDARGRPSPIVVKLFELKTAGVFDAADFFSLFDRERDTLGDELVKKEELTLRPGDRLPLERQLEPDTRFIGVIAGYRGLDRARWRSSTAIAPNRTTPMVIRLDAEGVTIGKE
jgi:type VI secretion system protein VasD